MPIDPSVELDDADLDFFCVVDVAPGRRHKTRNRLAFRNLERAGAVRIEGPTAGAWTIVAIVDPEELDL